MADILLAYHIAGCEAFQAVNRTPKYKRKNNLWGGVLKKSIYLIIATAVCMRAQMSRAELEKLGDPQYIRRSQELAAESFARQLMNPFAAREAGLLALRISGPLWVAVKDRRYGVSFTPELYNGGPAYLPFGRYQYEASEYVSGRSCRVGVNGHFMLLPDRILLIPEASTTDGPPGPECLERLGLGNLNRKSVDEYPLFNSPTPYHLSSSNGKLRWHGIDLVPDKGAMVMSPAQEQGQREGSRVWTPAELNARIDGWRRW